MCARALDWWRGHLLQAWCRRLTREARNWTSGTRHVSARRTGESSRWAASASATTCSSAYPRPRAPRASDTPRHLSCVLYHISEALTYAGPTPDVAINSYDRNTYMTIPLTRERCTTHSHSASLRWLASWSRGNNTIWLKCNNITDNTNSVFQLAPKLHIDGSRPSLPNTTIAALFLLQI